MSKVPLLISLILLLTSISAAGAVSVENVIKLNIPETELWDPVISPDGTKVAYVAYDDQHIQQVFVINVDGTGKTKLTDDAFKKWGLAWGPDKIAYVSFGKDGLEKIFVVDPDGTENKQLILDNTRQGNSFERPAWAAPSWSPDGEFLMYTSLDEMTNPKMYIVNADGTGKRLVFNDTFKQWSPAISPDGKSIVYVSYNDRLREELFIVDIVDAAGTGRRQLTFDEIKKNNPVWGPDGTITYVSYEDLTSSAEKIFAINTDGTSRRLFTGSDYRQISPAFSSDGKKFSYAAIDSSGTVRIAVGDVAGITAAVPTTTPAETARAVTTQTVAPTAPAIETPVLEGIEEESEEEGGVLWTMFMVLAVIIIVLLILLVVPDILSKN